MKTKSIVYARNGIALLAILAAVPVSAQVIFASGDNSLATRGKPIAASFLNYYTVAEPASHNRDIGSIPFPSSSPVKNANIAEEIILMNTTEKATDVSPAKNDNRLNAAAMKISLKRTSFTYPVNPGKDVGIAQYSTEQLMLYATILKQYARKKGFDTTYAFFSNMGMLTNKKRFFVVNLVTMKIEHSGLVAQGRGTGASRFDKQYSNKKDSKCTSLGRYKIMKKYKGEYGEAYKMMGLDSSNCNAYKRSVVLHSMGCMPDTENNMPLCISEGCPAVSLKFLSYLSSIIDSRKKPILLWIFDSNLEEVIAEQTQPAFVGKEPDCIEEKVYHRCPLHQEKNRRIEL